MSDNNVQEPPCTIHTKKRGAFNVPDVGAWAYQDWGIFASGHWNNTQEVADVLIPYGEVQHIEFHFAALERYHAAQLIESIENPEAPLDDEPEAEAA